ncbi:MAG TPA: hypothetical protein VK177_09810 [Flavobacteriales bacterium]|nr:hypothetical protein [Flavobacteriales bacterium]
MKRKGILIGLLSLALKQSQAQDVHLHVREKWENCSFQIDPSLTQDEWHRFTKEAAMVICFRSLASAAPLGAGKLEFGLLQWKTKIDETAGAWNNTFVHPHDEHYLIGGPVLPIPGITMRMGLTNKLDAGAYWTFAPGANYGFTGAQLQYNFMNAQTHKIDVSSRIGVNRLYGPDDINFTTCSADVLAGKKLKLYKNWLSVSPYIGCSGYYARAHEKTSAVQLKNESVFGLQAMAGANIQISHFNVGVEYNVANVNTLSFKLAGNFRLCKPKQK